MVSHYDREKFAVGPGEFAGLELDQRTSIERGEAPAVPPKTYYNGTRYAEMGSPASPQGLRRLKQFDDPGAIARYDQSPEAEKYPVEYPISMSRSPTPEKSNLRRPRTLKLAIGISVLLVVIIIAAVLGGILGSRSAKDDDQGAPPPTQESSVPTPTASPEQINSQLPGTDVMVDSPLSAIAFNANSATSNVSPGRNIQVFYQTAQQSTQQIKKAGIGDWSRMEEPIFTDAAQNAGFAAFTFVNDSNPQTNLFYASNSNTLREKRLFPNDPNGEFWELAPISYQRISLSGNSSIGKPDSEAPDNGWGGYRLAAAYSANFSTGAGARLFYHSQNDTDSWISELIWNQQNDTWSNGTKIFNALPGSHLSAVVDPDNQALRLFYVTDNNTLSESWLNISDSSATYQSGIHIPDILMNPSADIATVSASTGTYLYYASQADQSSNITIRELKLPEPTGGAQTDSSSTPVTTCNLMAKNTGYRLPSLYVPVGAAVDPGSADQKESITVFWPEEVEDQQSGYGALKALTRPIDGTWKDEQVQDLPLATGGDV